MQRNTYLVAAVLVVIILVATSAGFYFSDRSGSSTSSTIGQSSISTAQPLQVVAAENFWGNLISQLGGSQTQVLSIVTDPNADPHEYASNSQNAQAIAKAALVVINGAGYDNWALKLIAASNTPHQVVLNVADLLGKKAGDNPHFWYSPYYVNDTVKAMYLDLISIDPADTAYFTQQYASLNASLGQYNTRISEIREQFAGRRVAATEDIFVYVANATGLDLVSPPAFMEAVAEGNDPPAQSIVQFQQLIQDGNFSVLVYNAQTVSPLTQNIKAMAAAKGIPIVAVTETIQPPDVSFQDWMNAELITLQNALNAQALGQ